VGHPHVDKQITAVTTLLRATPDGQWNFLKCCSIRHFHRPNQICFLAEEIARLKSVPNDWPPLEQEVPTDRDEEIIQRELDQR
jgi:hypothetical protein